MSDELNLPWKVYFFGSDGKYDKDKDVYICPNTGMALNNSSLTIRMREHNKKKLEIRVCDSLDYCIMHWKDGERIFP